MCFITRKRKRCICRLNQKDFSSIQADVEPIFREIEHVKERYGLTTLTLESFQLSDQFGGCRAVKDGFTARREFRHRRDSVTQFKRII